MPCIAFCAYIDKALQLAREAQINRYCTGTLGPDIIIALFDASCPNAMTDSLFKQS